MFPPLLVLSTAADHLWAALFRHRHNLPIWLARAKLSRMATYAVDLNETDAAYANERLHAFLHSKIDAHVLPLWLPCGCHQTCIVETGIIGLAGIGLLGRLFALAKFLKAGRPG